MRTRRSALLFAIAACVPGCSEHSSRDVPVAAKTATATDGAPSPQPTSPSAGKLPLPHAIVAVVRGDRIVIDPPVEIGPDQVFRVTGLQGQGFRATLDPVIVSIVDAPKAAPRRVPLAGQFRIRPFPQDVEGTASGFATGDEIELEPLAAIPGSPDQPRQHGSSDVFPRRAGR